MLLFLLLCLAAISMFLYWKFSTDVVLQNMTVHLLEDSKAVGAGNGEKPERGIKGTCEFQGEKLSLSNTK